MNESLEPELLKTFLAVAEHGGISKAAKAVSLSQPAVTAQMRRLEESVGVPLLLRSARGVAPTPAGERLLLYARRIHALLEEALGATRASNVTSGPLSLMASTTIAAHVLPPVLARFRERHPKLAIRLKIGNTEEVVAAVLEGEVPLGLVEGPRRAAGVRLEPWVHDALVPVTGSDAGYSPRSREDLERIPILWREPGSGTRTVLARAFKEAGIRSKPQPGDLVLRSSETIAGAAAAGLGVAFLSRFTLSPYLAAGRLRLLPTLDLTVRRTFHWALPAGGLGGTAQEFLSFARRTPPAPR